MSPLKSLLRTLTLDLPMIPTSNHSKNSSKPRTSPRFITPPIQIHHPHPSTKLFRHLLTPPTHLLRTPPPKNTSIFIYPSPHPPTPKLCNTLTSILLSHTAASGNSAFAVLHVHIPHVPHFDAYLHPFSEFPTVILEPPVSPLAVCQCFIAVRTCGMLLPSGNFVPIVARESVILGFERFRWVVGRAQPVDQAICALVQAVNHGVLERNLEWKDREKYKVQLDAIQKWAFSHPTNRVSVMTFGGGSLTGNVHPHGIGHYPKTEVVSFPSLNRTRNNESLIRVTTPRERWNFLTFLSILSPTTTVQSLAKQSPDLCQHLAANSHTYTLTCLDGRERGFQVCHWDGMDSLPVVVEMELVEEEDGSRSIVAMGLVRDKSLRVGFKNLACAEIGEVVCWRDCCGLVESLGLFVCGVLGDQLAVADCSVWFVGLI